MDELLGLVTLDNFQGEQARLVLAYWPGVKATRQTFTSQTMVHATCPELTMNENAQDLFDLVIFG